MLTLEENEKLISVLSVRENDFNADEEEFKQIVLLFQNHVLIIEPIIETDEVKVSEVDMNDFKKKPDMEKSDNLFKNMIGQNINDLWLCKNGKGYTDLIVISFDLLLPNIAFLSIGSAIRLYYFDALLKGKR